MIRHLIILVLGTLLLSGCAVVEAIRSNPSSRYIRTIDWPVTDIRAAVIAQLPVGEGSISTNGREITSKYFAPAGDRFRDAESSIDRYFVQVTILGDHRPYDVEVSVTHERRVLRGNDFVYAVIGTDARLTRVLEERLRTVLTKRREERNIIDDFRVY